ncbi:MAG: hypothetical protein ACTHK8_18995 [Ginsengibacter sp.]
MIYKPGDKKLINDFEELVDIIKASTGINPYESAGDKKKRVAGLLKNYEAFCAYYFPEYCFAPFAWFHKGIQKDVAENPNHIFLEQWSRGFAKSTHFGLFLPLYIKFNGLLNGVMVGSYNETMAGEKLLDVQANLQYNQRIINDFGVQFSYGNWEEGNFKTRDDVGFYAFGKGQSPRGTRFKWKRPNYGIVDDLNDARQLKNPVIAEEDKRWVLEELKPALWTRRWWLVVAQNKFHDNTVTALLEEDEEIKTKTHRVNIVNEKGDSNWPENEDFSKEAIQSLEESEGAGYIRERMNTPFEEGKVFKAEWMNQWVKPLPLKKYDAVIHYLDPSYKSTEKSDYKFWVLLGKTGKYYDILDAWGQKCTSKDMWEHAFDVDDECKDYSLIHHSMEANFIQEEWHKKELERVEDDKGRALRISFDRRAKGDKHARVETLQPLFQRGFFRFNIYKKADAGMKLLRTQFLAFEKGSRINDDGPDASEGAVWMADRFAGRGNSKGARTGRYKKNLKRSI